MSLKQKIEKVCMDIYGASRVEYSEIADTRLKSYEDAGYGKLPVCMAKLNILYVAMLLPRVYPQASLS